MNILFVANSILLGAGLSMDAFSVSCANAIREPGMRVPRMVCIAGVYGIFQFLMPMAGWACVHTVKESFSAVQDYIPWAACLMLVLIGGKMLLEGIKSRSTVSAEDSTEAGKLTVSVLLLQGIATSIDALSVGFTIAGYGVTMALAACLIIGAVTFVICMGGLAIGRRAGRVLTGKADIIGGIILIGIGLEIVITHFIVL